MDYSEYLGSILTYTEVKFPLIVVIIDGNNILYDYEQLERDGIINHVDIATVIHTLSLYLQSLFPHCQLFFDFVFKSTLLYHEGDAVKASLTELSVPFIISHITNPDYKRTKFVQHDDLVILQKISSYQQLIPPNQIIVVSCDGYQLAHLSAKFDQWQYITITEENYFLGSMMTYDHLIIQENIDTVVNPNRNHVQQLRSDIMRSIFGISPEIYPGMRQVHCTKLATSELIGVDCALSET